MSSTSENKTELHLLVDQFIDAVWMESGLSDHTLSAYRTDLHQFLNYAGKDRKPGSFESADIAAYIAIRAEKTSNRTASRSLSSIRRFFQYLIHEGLVERDPCVDIAAPRIGKTLPKSLSEKDVETLIDSPNTATSLGLRDRAMFEVLYATGLRVSELTNLAMDQIDLTVGVCRVIGKGNKERLVPLGDNAVEWLQNYLQSARRDILGDKQSHSIFVTRRGKAMSRQAFWQNIKRYAIMCGVSSELSPHTLRHAFATHLLNHGADLRSVQMLLGHSSLSTTQIYTFVAKTRLQNLHSAHHPRG